MIWPSAWKLRAQARGETLREVERKLARATAANAKLEGRIVALDAAVERLRQERDNANRELADRDAIIDGLGLENTELEKRLERKQFLDEDDAFKRRMDGEGDHL